MEDVKKLGFLEELISGDVMLNDDELRYRVKRILKAFIGPDELQQLAQQIGNL